MKNLGKVELNDAFLDARFNGYSLAPDLIRSVTPLPLPLPPSSPNSNDISLQRHQARFKFNRLFVSGAPLLKKAFYAANDGCIYSISLQDKPNFTPVFKIPDKKPSPTHVDDISLGIVQVNESLLLLIVADGKGHIYILDLIDNSRVVFDAQVPPLEGKPFTIIDCSVTKSGNVRCLIQHIEDAPQASSSANQSTHAPLHFVRESEGTTDDSDAPQMEIGAQPKAPKTATNFHIHLLTFAPNEKTYTLASINTLHGNTPLVHGLLDPLSDGILLISSSLFAPEGYKPEVEKSTSAAEKDQPALPANIAEIASRLAFMTSDKPDANPYSMDLMRGKVVDLDEEDYDDDVSMGGMGAKPEDLLHVYYYDNTCQPTHTLSLATFSWVCLGGLQFSKSEPTQFTTFGLKCGVDCSAFKIVLQPGSKNEPFRVEPVANFPALSYVQNGKKNRKFTSFDPSYKWACVSEFERFAYFYQNQLPINSNHKSVHQILELPEGSGSVVGMQFLPENVCLLLTSKDVLVVQLKNV